MEYPTTLTLLLRRCSFWGSTLLPHIKDAVARVFQEPWCVWFLPVSVMCLSEAWVSSQSSRVSVLSASSSKEQMLTYFCLLSPSVLSGFALTMFAIVQAEVGNLAFPTGHDSQTPFKGVQGRWYTSLLDWVWDTRLTERPYSDGELRGVNREARFQLLSAMIRLIIILVKDS